MATRLLGKPGMEVSTLSYGASSLGQEFRKIDIDEALKSVHVAIDSGINHIDTSPFYGRGMSEMLLGRVLPEIPRESYYLQTELGKQALLPEEPFTGDMKGTDSEAHWALAWLPDDAAIQERHI